MKRRHPYLLILIFIILPFGGFTQSIKPGDAAPDFTVQDSFGNPLKLSDFKNQKVFLAFFRYAGCPLCNFRMHELMDKYEVLREQGYTILAVFESTNETLREYTEDIQPPFLIIGDPTLRLYKKYHVQKSFFKTLKSAFQSGTYKARKKGDKLFKGEKYKRDGGLTRLPADFIIDENGNIRIAHYGKSVTDHLPLDQLLSTN